MADKDSMKQETTYYLIKNIVLLLFTLIISHLFLGCHKKPTQPEINDWTIHKDGIPFKTITKLYVHNSDIWVPDVNSYHIYLLRNNSWYDYFLGENVFPVDIAFENNTVWIATSKGLGKLIDSNFTLINLPDSVFVY